MLTTKKNTGRSRHTSCQMIRQVVLVSPNFGCDKLCPFTFRSSGCSLGYQTFQTLNLTCRGRHRPVNNYTSSVLHRCLCCVTGVTTAAVCVYPSRVADAVTSLKAANSSLPVASGKTSETEYSSPLVQGMKWAVTWSVLPRLPVATGFPAGQTPLETRLQEVRMAVADGATEIDIVINRTLALTGQWEGMLQPHDKKDRKKKKLF